jgi:hypothetical protein
MTDFCCSLVSSYSNTMYCFSPSVWPVWIWMSLFTASRNSCGLLGMPLFLPSSSHLASLNTCWSVPHELHSFFLIWIIALHFRQGRSTVVGVLRLFTFPLRRFPALPSDPASMQTQDDVTLLHEQEAVFMRMQQIPNAPKATAP